MKETKLCAREWVDMTAEVSVILEVNFMIKLVMRSMFLSLFPRKNIKEILIHLGDDLVKI